MGRDTGGISLAKSQVCGFLTVSEGLSFELELGCVSEEKAKERGTFQGSHMHPGHQRDDIGHSQFPCSQRFQKDIGIMAKQQ
ncbi:hypothetical protein P7K49_028878 [Saguinus oedipus]|uniref:Uncharacterized protein n=1 Tax=Saguinus oedipus TaxID=9490 RepID=A0ABQ9U6I4_SAGOE|nr:hypothetical protein P7K49_028878 [Saguinus oedipus]